MQNVFEGLQKGKRKRRTEEIQAKLDGIEVVGADHRKE